MAAMSRIGEKSVIVGNIHGDGDLEVMGRVTGDITVEGNVVVARSAVINGTISATVIRVAGSVEGKLEATDTVSIEPEARLLGDLTTPRVSIAEGAVVRGMLRTEGHPTEREPAARKAAKLPESQAHAGQSPEAPPTPPRAAVSPPELRHAEAAPDLEPPARKKGKSKDKRPPEPKIPALAKGTKGKKKGDKR